MSNYPPGAKYDSRAPWNLPEPEEPCCPKCGLRDYFKAKGKLVCRNCWTKFDEYGTL